MKNNQNILKEKSWGISAVKLISILKDLSIETPTALLIRHSERHISDGIQDDNLTLEGEQGAFEFGCNLPLDFSYRLFYSPSSRCVNTAQNIHKGIQKMGGASEMKEPLDYILKLRVDSKKVYDYVIIEGHSRFLSNWLSGLYPPEVIESSIALAKRAGIDIKNKLATANPKTVDIHVSHDIYVAATFFHLTGALPSSALFQPLNGFFMQIVDEKVLIFQNEGKKEIFPPYWLL